MNINIDKLKGDLHLDEGLRNKPYKDTVGKLSIGIGRNLDDVGISNDEAYFLLENDIKKVINDLSIYLPWLSEHPENVQRALANMAFNMGVNGLLTFSTTLQFVKEGDYETAAANALKSKWAKQVPNRAKRVTELLASGLES